MIYMVNNSTLQVNSLNAYYCQPLQYGRAWGSQWPKNQFHSINVLIINKLTVSCLAPLIPRIWFMLEPFSAGALSGAFASTAVHQPNVFKKQFKPKTHVHPLQPFKIFFHTTELTHYFKKSTKNKNKIKSTIPSFVSVSVALTTSLRPKTTQCAQNKYRKTHTQLTNNHSNST